MTPRREDRLRARACYSDPAHTKRFRTEEAIKLSSEDNPGVAESCRAILGSLLQLSQGVLIIRQTDSFQDFTRRCDSNQLRASGSNLAPA